MIFKLTLVYPDGSMIESDIDTWCLALATHLARMAYREAASITVEAATL
jgi:hypothetical protein